MWERERIDLPNYLAIVAELGARSVLDVGCGTGNWASMLADRGSEVVGLDPAAASLDVARAKPGGQRVRWIHGDVTSLPALAVDLATMTGNVSNVFLTQQAWLTTLGGVHAALRPGGYLVFESVDRHRLAQPWLNWNRERLSMSGASLLTRVCSRAGSRVTRVDGDLVSTRRTYVFAADGATLTSEGIRRYPPRSVIEDSLISAGYELTGMSAARRERSRPRIGLHRPQARHDLVAAACPLRSRSQERARQVPCDCLLDLATPEACAGG